VQNPSAGWIDHAGNNYTNAFACSDLFVIRQDLSNASRKLGNQNVDISVCLKTANYTELVSEQIRDHDEGSRCANIDTYDTSLPGIDVKKRRSTATAHSFTNGTFKDQRFVEEFADQKARDAAPHIHQSRQVSAGNRLMRANKIESDLAIDLAAGSTPRYCEIVRINLSHGY